MSPCCERPRTATTSPAATTAAALQRLTEALLASAGEAEPPPALRARLLDAFDREVEGQLGGASPFPAMRSRRPALPASHLAAAAVLVLALVALVAWNLVLQVGGDAGTDSVRLQGEAGSGEMRYLADEGVATFELELPSLPSGRVYQAWRIDDSGPASLGLLSDSGRTALVADLSRASVVAVAEEPAGGSDQPTSDPLLSADLAP